MAVLQKCDVSRRRAFTYLASLYNLATVFSKNTLRFHKFSFSHSNLHGIELAAEDFIKCEEKFLQMELRAHNT